MDAWGKLIKVAIVMVAVSTAAKAIRDLYVGNLIRVGSCCSSCKQGKTCGSP